MRLLQIQDGGKFSLAEHVGEHIPPYAILSHTWGADHEEVSFKDLADGKEQEKKGYNKLWFCGTQAAKDGLEHFWIDTCCIDKSSSAELTEAINSMFRWYSIASKCYVYLSDVSTTNEESFHSSRWFTRGWTLQELLAPSTVEFFSTEEKLLGTKISMVEQICNITGIPLTALQRNIDLTTFTVDERLSWAKSRVTKRSEDAAYSLLGLFRVHIPLIYGEGRDSAFVRLRREIELSSGNTSKQTFFNTPFRRDSDFVDRGAILDDLRKSTSQPGSCVALFGLGGVGKSQLAIEYTYRVQESSPRSVFWVHSGTQARFMEGYQKIAGLLKMNGWDDPKADTLQLVYDWLCNKENGNWVMVIDNADDETVFFDRSAKVLFDYIPQSENGRILITSRNRDLAYKLTGSHRSIIEVKPMNEADALALLEKKLGSDVSNGNASELLNVLDYMPLAITQAAAYIQQRAPRMSVKRYLEDFRKSEKDQSRLLTKDLGDARRDGRASNSIIVTWQTSFEHIRARIPTAASLLSLMCLFDRQGIPETLLQGRYTDGDIEPDFEDDIHTLISYSLIEAGSQGNFEMHRLVQTSTRKWLEVNNKLEKWKDIYTRILNEEFGNYRENDSSCQIAVPHVQAAIDSRPDNPTSVEVWAALLHSTAEYLLIWGKYGLSEQMISISFQARQRLLGPEHPHSLNSMCLYAKLLYTRSKYKEAEDMWRYVVATRTRVIGVEHADTLLSMSNLAAVYDQMGQTERSEELSKEVIELKKRVLGPEHPDTLVTLNNQVISYLANDQFEDAVHLAREVAEIRARVLGPEHIDTILSKENLATALTSLGNLEEAEELMVEALKLTREIFGDHPTTFISTSNLSEVYRKQENWQEAERLALQAWSSQRRWLGSDHPDTLSAMGRLGTVYSAQGLWDKAETIFVQTLETRRRVLNLEDPQLHTSMLNLAHVWKNQGKQDEAIFLLEECVQLQERGPGPRHSRTALSVKILNDWRLGRVVFG